MQGKGLDTFREKLVGELSTGTPEEVLEHEAVIRSHLGTDDSAIARSGVRTG